MSTDDKESPAILVEAQNADNALYRPEARVIFAHTMSAVAHDSASFPLATLANAAVGRISNKRPLVVAFAMPKKKKPNDSANVLLYGQIGLAEALGIPSTGYWNQ